MLSVSEMIDARDKLRTAGNLVETVRVVFLSAGYIQGGRILQDVIKLLADEINALDRAIASGKP